MSRGGGIPLLPGDTDGDPADGWMSDTGSGEAYVFARSGKLQRSPVSQVTDVQKNAVDGPGESSGLGLNLLFTPKAKNSKSQAEQQEAQLCKSRALEVKKKVDELYEFVKTKHNVHQKIKLLVASIKSGMVSVVREQQGMCEKIEKIEKELSAVNPTKNPQNPRAEKRDRDTPGKEEEKSKKQREDSGKGENSETEGNVEDENWKVVQNKNEKKSAKKKEEEKKKAEKKQEENKAQDKKTPRQRTKGDALIIETKAGATYADLLRKVRDDPALEELGKCVIKTRRTQKGEMLFELKKDPAVKSSAFKKLVEKSLGEEANVRALSQETVIECRDLDEITTEDELREALKAQCALDENVQMAIRMRKAYGSTQTASIRLSPTAANTLLEKGKLKVGWSVCSLKAAPRVTKQMERCFKCMGFGHQARNCAGPDRSKLCRKCGEEGHFANDCAKPAKCMLCKVQDGNGHVTGGFKCPEYKKAMANHQ